MKRRKKNFLSRSGVGYRVILDDDQAQVQIVLLSSKGILANLYTKKRKSEIQKKLDSMNLNLEMVVQDKISVTYKCPKNQQRKVLRAIAGS